EAVDFISTLEPKPGRSFGEESAQAVIPDVIVTKVGKEYVTVLNNEGLPRLQISPLYKKMLAKGSRIKKEERKYIRDRLNGAIGLMKAIDQREKTIYKITESIIKVQGDFLEKGIDYLKPLTLKKIARDVGMHESTVSRTTSNKYIQTSQGVFELKYFFTSGFGKSSVRPTVEGGKETTSSRSIKEAIKDLIDSEDAKKPLSDQKIANIFTINLGIDIARRTVTKYREEMRILPSHQRKRY
ncbi:RNA polymerase sigma-54 factor, partial [bacterium]|nr:RNA polymerase sigma-54 factor [bacterium]